MKLVTLAPPHNGDTYIHLTLMYIFKNHLTLFPVYTKMGFNIDSKKQRKLAFAESK